MKYIKLSQRERKPVYTIYLGSKKVGGVTNYLYYAPKTDTVHHIEKPYLYEYTFKSVTKDELSKRYPSNFLKDIKRIYTNLKRTKLGSKSGSMKKSVKKSVRRSMKKSVKKSVKRRSMKKSAKRSYKK